MLLKEIEQNFITEDINYECKARLNQDKPLGWLKTICAFANSKGGILYVGVENKTFKLIEFEIDELDKEKLIFYHEITNHFQIKLEEETNKLQNLKIMKISLYANYLNIYVINPNGQSNLNAKRHAKKKPTDFAHACGITTKGKYCFHSYQDNNMCVYPNGKLKDYNKKSVCGEVYFFQN